jgi:hypothetical protein
MDYKAKAQDLRERIFAHAEQGHGGPCLRSGPLDKMLEEWLRLNCAPEAPSYPYGHRVAQELPKALQEPGFQTQVVHPRDPVLTAQLGTWQGVNFVETPDPVVAFEGKDTIAWADTDFTDWMPSPDAALTLSEFRAQYLQQPNPLDRVQYAWPDPRPNDPKVGDIYVAESGRRSEWAGKAYGWIKERTASQKFRDQYRADPTPLIDKGAPIEDRPPTTPKEMTRMEIVERMRKQRGFI